MYRSKIPLNQFTLLDINPSLKVLIIGIPPPTEASNPICRLFFDASSNNSDPFSAIKALFAVTKCLPFSRLDLANS